MEGRHDGSATILPFPKAPSGDAPDERVDDLRSVLGDVLRDERRAQGRTLTDVASEAAVSVAYLSEIERGRKDVSSELLGAVIGALDLPLVTVLERCVERLGARAQGSVRMRLRAA